MIFDKSMKRLLSLSLVGIFASLVMCSCVRMKNASDTGALDDQQQFLQSIQGLWKTDCYSDSGTFNTNQLQYANGQTAYSGGNDTWAESTCSVASQHIFQTVSTYSYATGLLSTSGTSQVYYVNATVLSGETTFFGVYAAGVGNASSACGLTNWAAGVAQSWFLPGENCVSFLGFSEQPTEGIVNYTSVKIDLGQNPPTLQMGSDIFPNTNPNNVSSSFISHVFYKVSN